MTDPFPIESGKVAVLIMDYQNKQLSGQPETTREALLANATQVLAAARRKGIPVMHVEVRSRMGPPEYKPWDSARRKASGREPLGAREPLFEIHPTVAPQQAEVVVTKRRIGPFSTTDLDERLRDRVGDRAHPLAEPGGQHHRRINAHGAATAMSSRSFHWR